MSLQVARPSAADFEERSMRARSRKALLDITDLPSGDPSGDAGEDAHDPAEKRRGLVGWVVRTRRRILLAAGVIQALVILINIPVLLSRLADDTNESISYWKRVQNVFGSGTAVAAEDGPAATDPAGAAAGQLALTQPKVATAGSGGVGAVSAATGTAAGTDMSSSATSGTSETRTTSGSISDALPRVDNSRPPPPVLVVDESAERALAQTIAAQCWDNLAQIRKLNGKLALCENNLTKYRDADSIRIWTRQRDNYLKLAREQEVEFSSRLEKLSRVPARATDRALAPGGTPAGAAGAPTDFDIRLVRECLAGLRDGGADADAVRRRCKNLVSATATGPAGGWN
jgi:hypothetical protein